MYEIIGMDTLNTLFLTLLMKSWFLPQIHVTFTFGQNMAFLMVNDKPLDVWEGGKRFCISQMRKNHGLLVRMKDLTWESAFGFLSL